MVTAKPKVVSIKDGAAANWWLLNRGSEIWLDQSDSRPKPDNPRGERHTVVKFGPSTEDGCRTYGDRLVRSANAVWRP